MRTPIGDTPVLDAIDRRILAELQADGRMTNVELARRAGISAPPCLRRVRRLEDAGVIRGYHADSDPQKLGWEITFFAIVGLDSQKEAVLSMCSVAGILMSITSKVKAMANTPSQKASKRELAFVSDRSGSPQIYIMSADGTNLRRMTTAAQGGDASAQIGRASCRERV